MDKETLKQRRKCLGLSQQQLADKLGGIKQNTVARWERGEVGFPPYLEYAINWIEDNTPPVEEPSEPVLSEDLQKVADIFKKKE